MRKKLSRVALYTLREAKTAKIRKYKRFNDVFYFKPRHLHHNDWLSELIFRDLKQHDLCQPK